MADLSRACRWCGYDKEIGEHGQIGPADKPDTVVVVCRVPADTPPMAFVVVRPVEK